jgi:hypothetical protein
MSDIHALVKEDGKEDRKVPLPDAARWPIYAGSAPDCALVLDAPGVAPRQARLDRVSNHVYLTALEGDAKGEPERVDEAPFRVGPFTVRLVY